MNKKKIIIDDNIPFIEGRLEPVAETVYTDQFGFTPELVKDADALIIRTRTLCNEALLKGSGVKGISTATIGTDQIDIPWCQSNGIQVANSPGCNAPGVAQYVWSSLLRLGFKPEKMTLGIVGCGNVGSVVAEWGRKLGCRILVNDPPREEAGLPGEYTPLETLLREADAVTLHTPLIMDGNHPTYHLIGEKELALLKDGAIFINAARGPVTDNDALIEKLKPGSSIRTVIDTWEGEPVVKKELLDLVDIGTFHIAGYSKQGKERATRMAIENIERFLDLQVDKSGLAGPHSVPQGLTAEAIVESYNPYADTVELKANPSAFDTLRRNYDYRDETLYLIHNA